MAGVTLARLLKIKSRFTTEYKTQMAILHRENSRLQVSTSKVNRENLYIDLKDLVQKIIKVKALISQSNFDIFPEIYELQELKGFLAQIKSLSTKDGEIFQSPAWGKDASKEIWDAHIKQEEIDKLELSTTKELNKIQDKIDNYNAKKIVEIPDEWL
jgi:transcription elongation factor